MFRRWKKIFINTFKHRTLEHHTAKHYMFKHDLRTRPGETWQEALERFRRLCHQDFVYEDDDGKVVVNLADVYDDSTLYEVYPAMSAKELSGYEKTYAVVMPGALQNLLLNHGRFGIYWVNRGIRWGERPFLDFYSSKDPDLYPNIMPLMKAVAFNYGDYFEKDELSAEQIALLNLNYFCFAFLSNEDSARTYLLFDRSGRFGTLHFDSEDYPENVRAIEKLLEDGFSQGDFDEFMARQIDLAIRYVLEYNQVLERGEEI
jgi:hypothetical protein